MTEVVLAHAMRKVTDRMRQNRLRKTYFGYHFKNCIYHKTEEKRTKYSMKNIQNIKEEEKLSVIQIAKSVSKDG